MGELMESINTAYMLGVKLAETILDAYGKDHWLWKKREPRIEIGQSDLHYLRTRFGHVNTDMQAAYLNGFDDTIRLAGVGG
jgi:hypothetical protein